MKKMILVAGPYRSATNDDPRKIADNVSLMTNVALELLEKGYLPILGEWVALPLIEAAGSQQIGDAIFTKIFHPVAIDLLSHCDAVLRVGGPSQGADEMLVQARQLGKAVFRSISEIHF
ncbi:DUF4406 domain-containing protein [Larkinella rosea]|uniref:DUF4406 domain-containing protein n=1 Tax=Larkinella rosea TaxID=2025312 RepID=A0A3P1C1E4_9BACT|nr:DUF4406 domain-containing protein [Larkinella rosea]RRB07215.1 DUF4406 domain-containing protein [Larkinella rosea]